MKSSAALCLCILFALAPGTMSAAAQDYQQALPGYRFEFPRDYFNHEDYQTEWWYYTGNLRAADGHRFGFELTFFRQGVFRDADSGRPGLTGSTSGAGQDDDPWFVRDLWMAHLALSDVTGQRFYHEERLNRSGPGMAGVDAGSGLVWNGNWQARIGEREENLRGVADQFGFGLKLVPVKAPVVQGRDGISRKAAGAGHASHYFSLTRLRTSGAIEVDGKTFRVEGSSWMDHEFFTGSMASDETGWDWLSVQMQDGSELMLYRLRHRDGSIDPYSSGSFVDTQGRTEFLTAKDFAMTPQAETWTSPGTGGTYPLRWRVAVPKLGLELEVSTPLKDQELTTSFGPSYWEGAIDVSGQRAGAVVRGVGYLEMTGYAGSGAVIPQ